jgi:folate-binding protein YgfZ
MGEKEEVEQLFSTHKDFLKNVIILSVPCGSPHNPSVPHVQARWELIGLSPQIQPLLELIGGECEFKEESYWTLLDIRAGIPEITAATSEQFLPHYLNLPALQALSFSKGCYHGQEVIARMQYRATIKKQMVYEILDKPDTRVELEENKDLVISRKNDNGITECLVIKQKTTETPNENA